MASKVYAGLMYIKIERPSYNYVIYTFTHITYYENSETNSLIIPIYAEHQRSILDNFPIFY